MYGVTLGRRQPMHCVHMDCIQEIMRANLHPVIIIGSANVPESHFYNPLRNPLTVDQQREQIRLAMEKEKITLYTVLPMSDMSDNNLWAEELARRLRAEGMPPEKCAYHYRTKAADPVSMVAGLPYEKWKKPQRDVGFTIWHSANVGTSMDKIEATKYRTMNLMAAESLDELRHNLVVPDYIKAQAKLARENNPDKEMLREVPITMLDLTLQRLHRERQLTTSAILGGDLIQSIEDLQQHIVKAIAPSFSILAALKEREGKRGEQDITR